MIPLVLLLALLQDGPVPTAPPAPRSQVTSLLSDYAATVEARQREIEALDPVETCRSVTNRRENETEFDCAVRLSYVQDSSRRDGRSRDDAGGEADAVPAWAFNDPARWETSQCGAGGDDACRRQARNRLAMARAGGVADPPATGGPASGADQNCRMVMQRSETGFGGTLSRVCGDAAAADELLRRRDPLPLQLAPEPCYRPASYETQATWIARCQALPPR